MGQALGDDAKDLDVLDLGCGTGLAGAEFRPLARRQTGVDLSPAMLALASGGGVYDELQQAEIVRFLQETAERFDLIVAADVLNYFGGLSPVFTGIACVLRPGGHCAVTLEAGKGADYRLRGMRRYQHAGEYVQRTAATARLCAVRVRRGGTAPPARRAGAGLARCVAPFGIADGAIVPG